MSFSSVPAEPFLGFGDLHIGSSLVNTDTNTFDSSEVNAGPISFSTATISGDTTLFHNKSYRREGYSNPGRIRNRYRGGAGYNYRVSDDGEGDDEGDGGRERFHLNSSEWNGQGDIFRSSRRAIALQQQYPSHRSRHGSANGSSAGSSSSLFLPSALDAWTGHLRLQKSLHEFFSRLPSSGYTFNIDQFDVNSSLSPFWTRSPPKSDVTSLEACVPLRLFADANRMDRRDEATAHSYLAHKRTFDLNLRLSFFNQHKQEEWFMEKYDPTAAPLLKIKYSEKSSTRRAEFLTRMENNEFQEVCWDEAHLRSFANTHSMLDNFYQFETRPILVIKNVSARVSRAELEIACRTVSGFKELFLSLPLVTKKYSRIGWVLFEPMVDLEAAMVSLSTLTVKDVPLVVSRYQYSTEKLSITPAIASTEVRIALDYDLVKQVIEFLESGASDSLFTLKFFTSSDTTVKQKLDMCILYLRRVHNFCYYCGSGFSCPEDLNMWCGIYHARRDTDNDSWSAAFDLWPRILEHNITSSTETCLTSAGLDRKDPDIEGAAFITKNTLVETEGEKYRCALCRKLFKGPQFVEKHITLRHGDQLEGAKYDAVYFNNYIRDPNHMIGPAITSPILQFPDPIALINILVTDVSKIQHCVAYVSEIFNSLCATSEKSFQIPATVSWDGSGQRGHGRRSSASMLSSSRYNPYSSSNSRNARSDRESSQWDCDAANTRNSRPPSGPERRSRQYIDWDAPSKEIQIMEIDYGF